MAKKQKYYVVWEGHQPGIYKSWTDCQLQIKAYPGAKYKSYKSLADAQAAFDGSYAEEVSTNKSNLTPKKTINRADVIWDSISVDAACSGNPGVMEYQGVHTEDGGQLFHKKFSLGTNNIGEFLAIVHALALLKKNEDKRPVYTDSKTALGWVMKRKCNTKLVKNAKTKELHEVIGRAEIWLQNNTYVNKILKWDTENWGEIPADFGRK